MKNQKNPHIKILSNDGELVQKVKMIKKNDYLIWAGWSSGVDLGYFLLEAFTDLATNLKACQEKENFSATFMLG